MTPPGHLDDAPKTEPEEDRLGFAGFARLLATTLTNLRPDNGYVLGLHGPWGGGKTTALNFVKSYLVQQADPQLVLVDFSPWLISGRQDLISAFFKVMAEAVSFSDARRADTTRKAKRAAAAAADPVFKNIGRVAAVLHPEGKVWIEPMANVTGGALKRALESWASEPSLQTAYKALRGSLRGDNRRFIVFIDDLDRLEPEEIKAIAQMVKSVGGLPNITYVLAYDRDIVWPVLDNQQRRANGRLYAEKIIQHEVSLPVPSKVGLLRLLNQQIGFLIADTPDSERWSDIVRNGLERWIRSVRDVVRLSNAIIFAAPALTGELDPQDLVAMEGLRLFDERAFVWVRENRELLLQQGFYRFLRKEHGAELIQQLHDNIAGRDKAQIIALLCVLFPERIDQLKADERPILSSSENHAQVAVRRGIGSVDGYDAFFSLALPSTRISNRDVQTFLSLLSDESALSSMLQAYLERQDEFGSPLICAFMEQVGFHIVTDEKARPTEELVSALLSIGDPIISLDDGRAGLERRPLAYFGDLLDAVLRRLGPEGAERALRTAFQASTTSLAAAADLFVDRGRDAGLFPGRRQAPEPLLSPEAVERLGPTLMARIEAAQTAGSLAGAGRYWDILKIWRRYGDQNEAHGWIRSRAEKSASDFSKIALGHLSVTLGDPRRGSYFVSRPPDDPDFSVEELLALSNLHINNPDLTSDEQRRLAALQSGLKTRSAEPTPGPPDGD